MQDLISRQAAVDVIEITPFDDYGDYMRTRELIEQLPSAQPHWIPCSERLPEENGEYLVTRESGFCRYIDIVIKSNCNSDLPMASDIKAWMPLPDSYKGEQE